MLAVADDLTGAAEIAAVGQRSGWRAQVLIRAGDFGDADLAVLDTDTRLAPADAAARALATVGDAAALRQWRLVYKKTDSVLRGPVLAELTALAAALGKKTMLLVPSNPSLGRVPRGGRYFVHGVPLDETAFARDPHHPARTSFVADLLGRRDDLHVLAPGSALPTSGIAIGEAASPEDLQAWAGCVDPSVLPAGGGEFFSAVLRQQVGENDRREIPAVPTAPTLLVCGTTAAPRRAANAVPLPRAYVEGGDESALTDWISRVLAALGTQPFVAATSAADRSLDPRAPARIREALARLVQTAVDRRAFRHLMIEGGATAAAIFAALGWSRLSIAREWAQGIVTLRPASAGDLLVTMKPGSYTWPEALWSHVKAPL